MISPVHSVAGLSSGELLGAKWVQVLELPADTPLGCDFVGKNGKVSLFAVDETCTVKPGTPVYMAPGTECSNVEDDPFFGADEAAQRECAIAFDHDFFVAITASVDGAAPVDVRTPRFEDVSPQMSVDLPLDNLLGVPAGPATFVAHGWAILVRGLTPGEHVITLVTEDVDGLIFEAVFTIDVVPRGHG